ncbi:MAG: MBL fold metallo-hydrolase [Sphaerochaetaceae bacterium]|nr:MBL fold metallo-hydrolase [Sphaerochaetaceae bacterium]
MKIVFFGNSGGIQGSSGGNTSFAVHTGQSLVLVDSSGSPLENLAHSALNPELIDALLLTHSHIDHIYALPSLIHNLWLSGRSRTLAIHSNRETLAKASEIIDVFGLRQKKAMFPIELNECTDSSFEIKDLRITPFPVNHLVPATGFVFDDRSSKIACFADCNSSTPIPDAARSCSLMVHEAGIGGKPDHSSGREAGLAAKEAGALELLLVHLPQSPELRARILSDARSVFRNTGIPVLFKEIEI